MTTTTAAAAAATTTTTVVEWRRRHAVGHKAQQPATVVQGHARARQNARERRSTDQRDGEAHHRCGQQDRAVGDVGRVVDPVNAFP